MKNYISVLLVLLIAISLLIIWSTLNKLKTVEQNKEQKIFAEN